MLAREEALHAYVLGPWSHDHASRPGSVIGQRPYDREQSPEQRIDTYKTPANLLPTYLLPSRLLSVIIEYKLGQSLHSMKAAHLMVETFRDRPASKTDDTPLSEKVAQIMDSGETLNFVDAHYEFTGGIKMLAAFLAAQRQRKYIRRANAIISKTMTREEIDGKSVAQLVSPVSGTIWVMPDTDSYERLIAEQDLDEETAALVKEAAQEVNRGGMQQINRVRKLGGILQWAPFSSALARTYNSAGNLTWLKTPNIPDQVPGLLGRARYTLPVAYANGDGGRSRWAVGDLIDRDAIEIASRRVRDGIYLERTVGALCTMQAQLTGVPVEHLGKVFEPAS